jgi:phytoene desaturase
MQKWQGKGSGMNKRIAVIGSGFGGLGVAIRLAARGYQVEIFEKRDKPGGRAYTYEIDGFKFDGGPTVITAPFMFDDLWKEAGKDRRDYFEMVPVDPFYRVFDWQGRHFDVKGDLSFTLGEIERVNPSDRPGYLDYIRHTQPIFEKGFLELSNKPFLKLGDMLKVAPDLMRLQSYKSVYSFVSHFVKEDFLRRVLTFHTLLIGGNPFDTTSIYALIHYIQNEWGVWYAKGGTGAIIAAMARLFEELGGKIHLNQEVCEILVQGRQVTGIRLEDNRIDRFDAVVSNADPAWTYRYMIPSQFRHTYTDRRLDSMRYSMSLFVLYFGTRRRYRQAGLEHHNIILSQRYKGLLDDIFNKKVLSNEFSLYLHMPTLTDPSMAPEGCETFYVLSPVPHLDSGVDWKRSAKPYGDAILKFLEENYLPDLRANIVARHSIDPLHFQNTLNSYKGAAFSFQPLLTQSAWFRPHNRAEDFDNLYFVGAGTHPGAGVPGVLSSSIIAANLIAEAG